MDSVSYLRLLNTKYQRLIIGFACVLLMLLFQARYWPVLNYFSESINRTIYDVITRLSMHPVDNSPRVIIVDIDDYSIIKEGRWPWPRDKIALMLDNLRK